MITQCCYSFLKYAATLVLLLVLGGMARAQQPFVTIWKTDNPGIAPDNQIVIPAFGNNFNIEWQEIGHPTNSGSAIGNNITTLIFPNSGIYRVRISPGAGTFHRIAFANSGDCRKLLGIEQWGDVAWSSMELAFYGCANLSITSTDIPNLSNVTKANLMFASCAILNGPDNIDDWDMATVTNMSRMFKDATAFNQPIGNWSTAAVTDMSFMFSNARSFNQSIGGWNMEGVTNVYGMFYNNPSFNQPIGDWNTAMVTQMGSMFLNATAFNQPLGDWNTASVVNMNSMFENATAFNQPIGAWNTGAVLTTERMFMDAIAFNQPIGNWNTASIVNMRRMFQNATSFNQPIGSWNVSQVTQFVSTFRSATAFNQSIGDWTLSNVVNLTDMLDGCGIDCNNYSATLIGWSNNPSTRDSLWLQATAMQYGNNAISARNYLIDSKNWHITGDAPSGEDCSLPVSVGTMPQHIPDCTLFPNPATTQVSVTLPAFVGKRVQIQIITLQGLIIEQRQVDVWQDGPLSFDLNHYPDGMYWITVQPEGGKRQVKKLVVAQ